MTPRVAILCAKPPLGDICAVEFYARSQSQPVSVQAQIWSMDNTTATPKQLLASGTTQVGAQAGAYRVDFSKPVKLPGSDPYFVVLDGVDKLILPTSKAGTSMAHMEWQEQQLVLGPRLPPLAVPHLRRRPGPRPGLELQQAPFDRHVSSSSSCRMLRPLVRRMLRASDSRRRSGALWPCLSSSSRWPRAATSWRPRICCFPPAPMGRGAPSCPCAIPKDKALSGLQFYAQFICLRSGQPAQPRVRATAPS